MCVIKYTAKMKPRLLLSCFLLLSCLASPALGRPLAIATLEVPPLVVADAVGNAQGPAVDVVREVLRRAGYEASIKVMPWKRAIEMVRRGQADGLFPATKSAEREQFLLYPGEAFSCARVVAVAERTRGLRMDMDGTGTDGLVVGMLRGGSHGPELETFLRRARFGRLDTVAMQKQGALMTHYGHYDAFIIVDTVLPYFNSLLEGEEPLAVVKKPDGSPFIIDSILGYLALSAQSMDANALCRVDSALRSVKLDGFMARLIGASGAPLAP